MYAETIDTGATINVLRAFGPPDVVEPVDLLGNGQLVVGSDGFWTVVRAVQLTVVNGGGQSTPEPILTWRALEDVPFATAVLQLPAAQTYPMRCCFGIDLNPAASFNGGVVVASIPELVLLPGWTLSIGIAVPSVGDIIEDVRCCVQRYQLINVDDLNGD